MFGLWHAVEGARPCGRPAESWTDTSVDNDLVSLHLRVSCALAVKEETDKRKTIS